MPEQYSISWAKASESETPAPHCSTPSNAEQRLENESEKRTCTTRTNLRGHCPRVREKPIAFNYALRTHYDTLSDEVSNATGLDTGDETPVRQEFAHDADINVLLNKYNVDPRGRPIEFKEVDYTLDLQQAIHAVEMAKGTVDHVPPELRNQFPTWQAVLNGAENGSYAAALKDLDDKNKLPKIRQQRQQHKPPPQRQQTRNHGLIT